jgi:hypothetical protein
MESIEMTLREIISHDTLMRRRPLAHLVMAALEAAIQPIRATAAWRLGWMAGSGPGHDGRGETRRHFRFFA